jgi:hypothetical protein
MRAEAASSNAEDSRNKYLDNLDRFHADLLLPYGDERNYTSHKTLSHLGRLGVWWQGFVADPRDDYMTARQIFGHQMRISGCRKAELLLRATSQEDYQRLRREAAPVGVNIGLFVTSRTFQHFGRLPEPDELAGAKLGLDELHQATAELITHSNTQAKEFYRSGKHYAGQADSPITASLRDEQRRWTELAVDHILYAAQIRGGNLARVPLLHPVSISDQPTPAEHYPFANSTPH